MPSSSSTISTVGPDGPGGQEGRSFVCTSRRLRFRGRAPEPGTPRRCIASARNVPGNASTSRSRGYTRAVTEKTGKSSAASPLRIGLIGCGTMGTSHATQMAKLAELRLAAVCDVDEAKARAAADAAASTGNGEVRVHTDVAALLADPTVPAVIVATPNFTHRAIVLDALAARKHVFCEKPMALSLAHCDEMIAGAERHGRKLMVGQVLRLMTVYATVRRLVEE